MPSQKNEIDSRFRITKRLLGEIGQNIPESIYEGTPRTFLDPQSRSLLKVDIYNPKEDSAVEVKAGGSRVKEYQIAHQSRKFKGGLRLLFVQNPFTGENGPDLGDYIILRQRAVPYSQVWFSALWGSPEAGELQVPRQLDRLTEISLPFGYNRKKRGLREIVILILYRIPMTGSELIDAVEKLTHGEWRPTSGSMYPLLLTMREEGILNRREIDDRYELSDSAKNELGVAIDPSHQGPQTVEDAITEMHSFVSNMEDLKSTKKENLEPHVDRLRSLAKRLQNLVPEDSEKES